MKEGGDSLVCFFPCWRFYPFFLDFKVDHERKINIMKLNQIFFSRQKNEMKNIFLMNKHDNFVVLLCHNHL